MASASHRPRRRSSAQQAGAASWRRRGGRGMFGKSVSWRVPPRTPPTAPGDAAMKLRDLSIALAMGASALALAAAAPPSAAWAAPAAPYHAPRNAFGQPDLQGNWTNATITPF